MKPSHSSTNPENLAKVGPVDSEITGAEVGPLKYDIKKKNISRTYRLWGRHAARAKKASQQT